MRSDPAAAPITEPHAFIFRINGGALWFEGLERTSRGIAGRCSRRAVLHSPQSDPALDLITEALAYADGVTRKDARRALVLARSGERWVGPLSERGFAVTVQEDVSALGVPDGSMD